MILHGLHCLGIALVSLIVGFAHGGHVLGLCRNLRYLSLDFSDVSLAVAYLFLEPGYLLLSCLDLGINPFYSCCVPCLDSRLSVLFQSGDNSQLSCSGRLIRTRGCSYLILQSLNISFVAIYLAIQTIDVGLIIVRCIFPLVICIRNLVRGKIQRIETIIIPIVRVC